MVGGSDTACAVASRAGGAVGAAGDLGERVDGALGAVLLVHSAVVANIASVALSPSGVGDGAHLTIEALAGRSRAPGVAPAVSALRERDVAELAGRARQTPVKAGHKSLSSSGARSALVGPLARCKVVDGALYTVSLIISTSVGVVRSSRAVVALVKAGNVLVLAVRADGAFRGSSAAECASRASVAISCSPVTVELAISARSAVGGGGVLRVRARRAQQALRAATTLGIRSRVAVVANVVRHGSNIRAPGTKRARQATTHERQVVPSSVGARAAVLAGVLVVTVVAGNIARVSDFVAVGILLEGVVVRGTVVAGEAEAITIAIVLGIISARIAGVNQTIGVLVLSLGCSGVVVGGARVDSAAYAIIIGIVRGVERARIASVSNAISVSICLCGVAVGGAVVDRR